MAEEKAKKNKHRKGKALYVYISDRTNRKLLDHCEVTGVTKTSVIEKALNMYLSSDECKKMRKYFRHDYSEVGRVLKEYYYNEEE